MLKLYSRGFRTSTCSFKINMEHWAESCFVKDNTMREVNLSSILFKGGVWIDNQHNSSTWLVTQPVLWYLGYLHPGNTSSEFRRQIPNKGKEIWQNSTHFLFLLSYFFPTFLLLLPAARRRSGIWYESCKWLSVSANLLCLEKINSQSCCSKIS